MKGRYKEIVGTGEDEQRECRGEESKKGKGESNSDERVLRKEAKKKEAMGEKSKGRRRARKVREKIREKRVPRMCVHRTPRHIYAQVIDANGGKTLASASTIDKSLRGEVEGHAGNVDAAALVGKTLAERAKAAGVETVAFDRSGFRYHGRVKALADAAREGGLKF